MSITETSDYEKLQNFKNRYGGRYRLGVDKAEDGSTLGYYIRTKFKPERKPEDGEFPYSVWAYSDTCLAALVPSRTGKVICQDYKYVTQHLLSDEGMVVLFPADKLAELADALKLRRRRKLSPEQRRRTADRLRQYRFTPQATSDKPRKTERSKAAKGCKPPTTKKAGNKTKKK